MNIIDLSVFRKDDLIIKSLTGEEYNVKGNFSTEFYLALYDSYEKIQKAKKTDYKAALNLLKEIAVEILKQDETKTVTMQTIKEQFDDFEVLQYLLLKAMEHANKITNDPNSESLTSN